MVRSLTKRGMPRPFAILMAALLALYFVPFSAISPASATTPNFEIDGNQSHETSEDWADLTPGDMPDSGAKTHRNLVTFVDNASDTGADDTVFGSNNKEEGNGGLQWPNWSPSDNGNATGKSDYGRLAFYSYVENDHVFFVLGFDRGSNVGGTATDNYYFELNQNAQDDPTDPNPDRSVGDVRINLDDQGNGNITATIESWDGDSWGTAPSSGDYETASNTGGPIGNLAPWWTGLNVNANGTIDEEGFIEASFDLTSFGVVLGCPSSGFSTVNGRSTTGNADKNLVDYFRATPISVPSNCANLVINKEDAAGDPLGGAVFEISPNPLPSGTPGSNLSSLIIFDDSNNNSTVESNTNYDDPDATAGQITLPAVVPDVDYTITEVTPPEGYIGETGGHTVHPVAFGGDSTTFTNTLGSVKFFKNYAGDNADVPEGATFRLVRDSNDDDNFGDESGTDVITVQDNGANDANNTLGVIKVNDLRTGDYRIREIAAPTGWTLDPDDVFFSIPGANNTADVELADPTFTNPRVTYPLSVLKVAEANNATLIDGAVFNLYQESNGTAGLQVGSDTLVDSCTTGTDGSGKCTISGLAWGEDYYWYEVSVPSPYNLPNDRVVGPIHLNSDGSSDPSGVAEFQDPQSEIVTNATNGNLPDAHISDTATLSGVNDNATGTVTFDLYYVGATEPANTSCVAANLVQAGIPATEAVDGPGDYATGPISVDDAGYYVWVAHYSGDNNGNLAVDAPCDAPNETSIVGGAKPGIETVVPDSTVTLSASPTSLTDTATLSGASTNATGSISFTLYGPFASDPGANDCTQDKALGTVDSVETFSGNGTYHSDPVTVTAAGFYTWQATYTSGDDNNEDATHECGQASETVDVTPAQPTITTEAQQDEVTLSSGTTDLSDKATLAGATANATGSVTFSLYGPFASDPGASDCTAGKLVDTVGSLAAFTGNGTYTSMDVAVTEVGFYTWVATYHSGDGNNLDATHACGQAEETTLVKPAQPTITTEVPATAVTIGVNGSDLSDTAILSGATANATGSVTFSLYGPFTSDPGAADCTAANLVGTVDSVEAFTGNGTYTSEDIHVSSTGFYTWEATYHGDANNLDATHECGQPNETVEVQPRQPVMTTLASATEVAIGDSGSASFSDQAMLSEATSAASGTITFRLFGPGTTVEEACATTGAVQGSPVAVNGNGTYQGPTVSVSQTGYYTWVATYSGDANNLAASHPCGQPAETVHVTKSNPTLVKIANPASGSVVQPGDPITYSVTVGNTGDAAIDDGVVTDTLPGYVTVDQASVTASGGTFTAGGVPTTSAGTIVWTVDLAPGATKTLTYKVTVDFGAPDLTTLVNVAEFFNLKASTTHRTPSGNLTIVKEVSPVAGGGVVVNFGDTLTYTLTATASGDENQPNAVVTDYLPGFDPARPGSGKTTYVPGSATCVGAGTCTVTGPDAKGLITWSLGDMAAGTSRQVTFKVTIDDVAGDPGDTVAVDILNAGAVKSNRTPLTPSNEVVTPVTKVLPVKISRQPPAKELPHTGTTLPIGPAVGTGIVLLVLGLLLASIGRRRTGAHRL